ncbi:MAG: two-component system response regulator AlgR [Methylophilaceae bacterium]|jgi:two-component system response regulator AlgR
MVATSQSIKVLIANDETPAGNRLKGLLSDIEGVTIVAEAKNGKEAINLAIETSPDLMLLNIRMPLKHLN